MNRNRKKNLIGAAKQCDAPLIRAKNIGKIYRVGDQEVKALDGVTLDIAAGEFVAIMGPSGSGKSTMMNLIGALDVPTSGQLLVKGQDICQLSANQQAELRNQFVGFVFQQFNLLARTPALQQVMLPLSYSQTDRRSALARARDKLEAVDLADRMHHKPSQLSGGQQQRVAIARALVNNPEIILADEPTGALDTKTGREIMELFQHLNADGITIVIVTHEPEVAAFARRAIMFRDGSIVSDSADGIQPVQVAS